MNNIELSMGKGNWNGKVLIDGEEVHPRKVVLSMEAGRQPQVFMTFGAGSAVATVENCKITVFKEEFKWP